MNMHNIFSSLHSNHAGKAFFLDQLSAPGEGMLLR